MSIEWKEPITVDFPEDIEIDRAFRKEINRFGKLLAECFELPDGIEHDNSKNLASAMIAWIEFLRRT
jgi:hypothetical protein